MSRKRRKQSSTELGSEVTSGLDPTPEEKALQELEHDEAKESDVFSQSLVAQNTLCEKRIETTDDFHRYFFYQEDDVAICSNFLVARCPKGIQCSRHHTILPYVWQLRERATGYWYSIDEGAQLVLERFYSDPTRTQVNGYFLGSKMLIDFTSMTINESKLFDRIRRLSTSTDASEEFHTVYKYYYEESEDVWTEYGPDFVKCIEKGFEVHNEEVSCSTSLHKYSLHLANMVQTNLETETTRRMRKRPAFRSPVTMIARLRALCTPRDPPEQIIRDTSIYGIYPKIWSITDPSLVYEKRPVTCGGSEYLGVYSYFHKTMAECQYLILEISRIQNYFQWEKYTRKKIYMARNRDESKHANIERYLFHGTNPKYVEAILNQNFDPRVSGKNGTLYGKGCYFATDAGYSHSFSRANPEGHFFMFLAKVLVGRPTLGKPSYTRPPPLNPDCASSLLYDSCVNTCRDPSMFIIFDTDQFYPYFLIKYQKLADDVVLY